MDKTGVEMRVVNISNECGLRFTATTITDGKEVNRVGGDYSVPKMNLVGVFEMPFHQGTMHVAEGFRLWGRPPRRAARFRARPGHAGISRHLLASGYAALNHRRCNDQSRRRARDQLAQCCVRQVAEPRRPSDLCSVTQILARNPVNQAGIPSKFALVASVRTASCSTSIGFVPYPAGGPTGAQVACRPA